MYVRWYQLCVCYYTHMYLVVIVTIGLINMVSVKLTASIINVLAVVKVLALVFIVILGIWQLIKGGKWK